MFSGLQIRSLGDINLDSLNIMKMDGAAIPPVYKPPGAENYPTLNSEVGRGMKLSYGCCHCGAVTYTVKHKALDEDEVSSCNCSWCARVIPSIHFLNSYFAEGSLEW